MKAAIRPVPVVRSVADLRAQVAEWRGQGRTIAVVPTMGALHEGHLSLVRHALDVAEKVIVTLFVNPRQFGPNEDLDRYPRRESADAALLSAAGAHLLYAPAVEEMYPSGFLTTVHVGGVSEGLCGASRPAFFNGVATVVTKILLQALPDCAIFGEKDYQQLQVVKAMVRDLDIPVKIVGVPTVREDDGLALSSRNAYLDGEQRAIAPALYRVMTDIAAALRKGEPVWKQLEKGRAALVDAGFDTVDYLEARDAETMQPVETLSRRPLRLLAAVWLGKTRLIDNIAV